MGHQPKANRTIIFDSAEGVSVSISHQSRAGEVVLVDIAEDDALALRHQPATQVITGGDVAFSSFNLRIYAGFILTLLMKDY